MAEEVNGKSPEFCGGIDNEILVNQVGAETRRVNEPGAQVTGLLPEIISDGPGEMKINNCPGTGPELKVAAYGKKVWVDILGT